MKTAVLFSGGIESAVLAKLAHLTEDLGLLVLVNYGQTTFPVQYNIARTVADNLNCKVHVVEYDYKRIMPDNLVENFPQFTLGYKPTSKYTRDELTTDMGSLSEFPDWGWLNGRNAMFMLLASINASYLGCEKLLVGTQYNDIELDLATNPQIHRGCDTTRHIVDLMNKIIYMSFQNPFLIETPLLPFNKKQVVALGKTLGVDFNNTISCEYYPPCGMCSQCLDRKAVL